jgi:hypothetical protein
MSLYTRENMKLVELYFAGFSTSNVSTYRCGPRRKDEIFTLLTENGGGTICPKEKPQLTGHGTIVCGPRGEKLTPQNEVVISEKCQASFVVPVCEVVLVVYSHGWKKVEIKTFGISFESHKRLLSHGMRRLFLGSLDDLRTSSQMRHFIPAAEAATAKANCIGCTHAHYAL